MKKAFKKHVATKTHRIFIDDPFTGIARAIIRPKNRATPTPSSPPNFTYRGGPLIANPQVYVIFWGGSWASQYGDLMNQINSFYDTVLQSTLIDQLAEYNVPNYAITRGRRVDSYVINTPAPWKFTFDTQIRTMLRNQIAQGIIPSPTPNSLYMVHTQPGIAVINGLAISCVSFCGYHSSTSGNLFYGVLNYPNCKPCIASMSGPEEAITVATSHELAEAITDPIPGTGWYDNTHGEVGDVCEWNTKAIGGFSVQKIWSNRAGQCI
jgi:hypothetical protein